MTPNGDERSGDERRGDERSGDERKSGGVQSVERAITILEFLARNGWSGVTDVGNELGVHKSTAFRLLSTLERRGLVEQHADSGKYRLGTGLAHLARGIAMDPGITQQARVGCEWLARQTDETVTLTVLEESECVTIDQIVSTSTVISRSWLGRRTPVHCTSPGKVFLAFLPDEAQAGFVGRAHERFTERTITAPARLRAEIERVRAVGYATTFDEFEDGLAAAAAPVRAADGMVVAAIGVSGPSYRLGEDQLLELAPLVREAADLASARLGHLQS
ncbi:MAG: IclR family transcriptional regulator [Pseudonocardiaceae bacterium]